MRCVNLFYLVCIYLLRGNDRKNVVINTVALFVDPKKNWKRCQVSVICYLFCEVLSCNVVYLIEGFNVSLFCCRGRRCVTRNVSNWDTIQLLFLLCVTAMVWKWVKSIIW